MNESKSMIPFFNLIFNECPVTSGETFVIWREDFDLLSTGHLWRFPLLILGQLFCKMRARPVVHDGCEILVFGHMLCG